ncbi:MAG TPA: von Willebrand factor type A domain-containing protein, partial [Gemmatimonadaceae bacterium]|nr:von Willebrand factor type A domain-containing protein [Gemmatimonadaceae bacterium]
MSALRWSLLVPLLLAAAPPAAVTVTGRVADAGTGQPLAQARLQVVGTSASAVTDGDGRYRLRVNAPVGRELTLRAQRIGYQMAERRVRVTGDSIAVDFALSQETLQLSEVMVTGAAAAPPSPLVQLHGKAAGQPVRVRGTSSLGYPELRAAREPGNTESYAAIEEQPFLTVAGNPRSTFGIDVDRAAYGNIRRFINAGQRPPKDAVRIEELVNYFPYAYPAPGRAHPFSVTTEVAAAPWQPAHRIVRVGLQGRRIDLRSAPPNNLVFLVDVSGSMQSPDKLPLVKAALRLLVEQMRPRDRVAMVVYAGAAGLVLPSTPGDEKTRILAALDALEAGGSTAGGAGLRLAYDVAREHHLAEGNNRVVLATDGDFNVGLSSDAEMMRLVEERRRQGTFLTVLGFGTGNYKDSKLELLADRGNGNYAYVDDLAEARKVLVTEMGGTLVTIAKDVKVQVEFNPAAVRAYRLIGYENRALRDEDFADDTRDAGELGAGHAVTALYEVIPVGARSPVAVRGADPLRYQQPSRSREGSTTELGWVKLRYKPPTGDASRLLEQAIPNAVARPSADLRFATAVAEFGLLLRDSEFKGSASLEAVLARAEGAVGDDPGGYRADFVRLVRRYQGLEQVSE